MLETPTPSPSTPPTSKRPGFWKQPGKAFAEILGGLLYQGPK